MTRAQFNHLKIIFDELKLKKNLITNRIVNFQKNLIQFRIEFSLQFFNPSNMKIPVPCSAFLNVGFPVWFEFDKITQLFNQFKKIHRQSFVLVDDRF